MEWTSQPAVRRVLDPVTLFPRSYALGLSDVLAQVSSRVGGKCLSLLSSAIYNIGINPGLPTGFNLDEEASLPPEEVQESFLQQALHGPGIMLLARLRPCVPSP